MIEQLAFEFDYPEVKALAAQLADRRAIRSGPERLLVALVRQGLDPEAIVPAAGLVLELDRRKRDGVTGRLLTAREASERLAVSTETLLRWVRRGQVPAIRLPGGAIRIREDALERWLLERGDAGARSASYRGRRRRERTLPRRRPRIFARFYGCEHRRDPSSIVVASYHAADGRGTRRPGARLMPATQRGQAYRLGPNRWGLRRYDENGVRRRKSPFPSKSAALAHYRDVIEPQLLGEPMPLPGLTLGEFVPLYLERHAVTVRPRTIATLRDRLGVPNPKNKKAKPRHAIKAFGNVQLRDLERMADEIAGW